MAAPFDADWAAETITDVKLNRTTYGSGTTAEREAISNWPATRLFFDTDVSDTFYNSHASAPTSVTWSSVGGQDVSAQFPTTGWAGDRFYHTTANQIFRKNLFNWRGVTDTNNLLERFEEYGGTTSDADSYWNGSTLDLLRYSPANDAMDFDINNTNTTLNFDLGAVINATSWTLRFKMVVDTYTPNAGNGNRSYFFVGLSDTATTGAASGIGNIDYLGMKYQINSTENEIQVIDRDGSNLDTDSQEDTLFTHIAAAETIFFQIERSSATVYNVEIFSDATYSTSVETNAGTTASTVDNLRFIALGAREKSGSNHVMDGHVTDFEFYDGISGL